MTVFESLPLAGKDVNGVPARLIEIPDGTSSLVLKLSNGRSITISALTYSDGGVPQCIDIYPSDEVPDPRVEPLVDGADVIPQLKYLSFVKASSRRGFGAATNLCVLLDWEG